MGEIGAFHPWRSKRQARAEVKIPFIDAVLRVARSGGRWSVSPGRFGKYAAVKRRYYRFIERGVFAAMFAAVSDAADLEWLGLASTTIMAHQQAAGARKVKGGLMPRVCADLAAA